MAFLKEIGAEDIGLIKTPNDTCDYRVTVRGVIFNDEGKIAVVHLKKLDLYSLPGGKVDGNEGLIAGLKREMLEEVGTEIDEITFVGIVYTYASDSTAVLANVFTAKAIGESQELTLEGDEIPNEHTIQRQTPEKALELIALGDYEDEKSKLIQKREIAILEEIINQKKSGSSDDKKLKEVEEIAKKAQYDYVMLKYEFDAYIKRMEGETKEGKVGQLVELAKKMLPIVDQLGQSVSHIPAELAENTWASGVKLTYENALKTLKSLGISLIPTIGEEPDMELHEPLSVESTDDEKMKGKIIREFQPGYVYEKDGVKKVISAAKVIVGQ